MVETAERDPEALATRARDIRLAVGHALSLTLADVAVVRRGRIPKTTSGKVQRTRLLEAYVEGEFDDVLAALAPVSGDPGEAADEDALVADLVRICREVARDRQIGADDNLFEVGVSSLTLTEVVLAIDEKYPGKLDISDLFDYPTLREIAAFLRAH